MVEKARPILNQVFFNFKLNSWRTKPIRSSGRSLKLKSRIGETTLFELKSLSPRQMKLPILTCIMQGDFLPELKPLLRVQKLSCGNNLLDCTAGQYATYCFYWQQNCCILERGYLIVQSNALDKADGGVLHFLDSLSVLP